jgi:hypothetical protein
MRVQFMRLPIVFAIGMSVASLSACSTTPASPAAMTIATPTAASPSAKTTTHRAVLANLAFDDGTQGGIRLTWMGSMPMFEVSVDDESATNMSLRLTITIDGEPFDVDTKATDSHTWTGGADLPQGEMIANAIVTKTVSGFEQNVTAIESLVQKETS